MKYQDLLKHLLKMPKDRLQDDAVIYVWNENEYYPVTEMSISLENDILDAQHHYMVAK
jgi:hypothetical protein